MGECGCVGAWVRGCVGLPASVCRCARGTDKVGLGVETGWWDWLVGLGGGPEWWDWVVGLSGGTGTLDWEVGLRSGPGVKDWVV